MPRYFSKYYFNNSRHYTDSKGHETEVKLELFCKKLKDRVLRRSKNG